MNQTPFSEEFLAYLIGSLLPFVFIFVSIEKDISIGCLHVPVKMYKDSLHHCRVKCYILVSLWKIGVTFGLAFLLVPNLAMIQDAFGDLVDTPTHISVFNGTPAWIMSSQSNTPIPVRKERKIKIVKDSLKLVSF